jgi:hypothetical protein
MKDDGNDVKSDNENMVREEKKEIKKEEESSLVMKRRMVGGIEKEINESYEVLRIERKMEEDRGSMNEIRKEK